MLHSSPVLPIFSFLFCSNDSGVEVLSPTPPFSRPPRPPAPWPPILGELVWGGRGGPIPPLWLRICRAVSLSLRGISDCSVWRIALSLTLLGSLLTWPAFAEPAAS